MKNKITNKHNKNKIRRTIRTGFIFSFFIALSAFIFGIITINNAAKDSVSFYDTQKAFNGSQVQIKDATPTSVAEEVSISIAYTARSSVTTSTYASNVLTISTAEELWKLSSLCDPESNTTYAAFLTFDYKLLCNIDYDDYTSNKFIPIAWKEGTTFSGSFDGDGYDISNLDVIQITSGNYKTYEDMQSFAMFSCNDGEVKNFGLIDPIITVAYLIDNLGETGVSNVVGINNGTVTNVYVNQLNTRLVDECGITAAGGYRIAGLCVLNTGTISNSYIATNSVYNYTLDDVLEFADICLTNTGTISNCYFYDTSIDYVKSSFTENGQSSIVYAQDLGAKDKSFVNYYGIASASLTSLNNSFSSLSGWLCVADSGIESYFTYETPIYRNFTSIDDETNTIEIATVKDFLFMYEVMNLNAYFASNAITYEITADINLEAIPAAMYSYSRAMSANVTGKEITSNSVTLADQNQSTYPTIYNVDITSSDRKVTTAGIDAYGLFPYLAGSVEKINVVPKTVNLDDIASSTNAKAIGAVSGYIEGGSVSNVDVYLTVESSSPELKEYYIGGICGVLGGEGSISNSTTAGSFDIASDSSFVEKAGYMKGVAIGGVVGYVEDSLGNVNTCLNGININAMLGTSTATYAVAGVIGAGYLMNVSSLENQGTITVGSATAGAVYKNLYLSGVIGRCMGLTTQINEFENQGNVTLYGSTSATLSMVSGVINADIQTNSQFVDKAGNRLFYASSLTNRANVQILGYKAAGLEYTNVLNVNSANEFKTVISSLYNLNYNNIIQATTDTKRKTKSISVQEIDMYYVSKASGVLNVIGATSTYGVDVTTIYNLRNISYITSGAISYSSASSLTYAGVATGEYINATDIRNEGGLTFDFDQVIGTSGSTTTIKISGLLTEISSGCVLEAGYNSGSINVEYTKNIYANIYASGICYANRNGYSATEITKYNPLNANYDTTATGSINNVINSGEILITNPNYSSITYTQAFYWDSPDAAQVYKVYTTTYSGANLVGNIYSSGITNINESVITNTFNLANVSAFNYITSTTTTYEVVSSGIVDLNIGAYAYVSNSANNGDIFAINLSNGTYTTSSFNRVGTNNSSNEVSTKTIYLSDVTSAGIVARNDELENGDSYSSNTNNPNSNQVISFTINYGSIVAYNFRENITTTSERLTSKSAGIMGNGLASVVNVLNYGNVYGSEIVAGIFGSIYLTYYESELSSSSMVYIANTIDYGNVYYLAKGYDVNSVNVDYNYLTYSNIYSAIGDAQDSFSAYATTSVNRGTAYNVPTSGSITFLSYAGGVYGFINYNSSTKAQYISIRYLLNFNENLSIAGSQIYVPTSVTIDTSTIYSCYTSTHSTGVLQRDIYLTSYVNYAPLNAQEYSIEFISTYGNSTKSTISGYGLFSSNFTFRKVIERKYVDGSTYYNTTAHLTDKFLTDYFQFASYNYVNSELMDKIGWKTIAYLDAANELANSLYGMNLFFEAYDTNNINATEYSQALEDALNTSSWSSLANPTILYELMDELVANNDEDGIIDILEAVFADTEINAIFTDTFRSNVVDYILEIYPSILTSDAIFNFTNSYSVILAEALSASATDDENNDVKEYIADVIDGYLTTLGTSKKELLLAYVDYLDTYGENFFNGTLESVRYQLLIKLFENVTDDSFYTSLYSLFSDESKEIIDNFVSSLAALGGYENLENDDKVTLYQNILNNNSVANIATYLDTYGAEIGLFTALNDVGYNITSFSDMTTKIDSTNTSNSDDSVTKQRVALWNQIKDTTTFTNYFSSLITETKYFYATEYNNTYQTTRNPEIPDNQNYYNGYTYPRGQTQITAEQIGTDHDLMFFYEDDVTESTYFLGPYANSSGGLITNRYNNPSGQTITVKVGDDLTTNTNQRVFVPIVIYNSSSVTSLKSVANSSTTGDATNSSYVVYYNECSRQQFSNQNGLSADSSYTLLKQNTSELVFGGVTYSLNKAQVKIDNGYLVVLPNGFSKDEYITLNSNCTIDGTPYSYSNARNYIWNYLTIPMYTTTTTTNWHKTGYSGLYMYKENWGSSNYCLIFDGNGKYSPILTTRYIDYSAEQMLALDGYRTRVSSETKPEDSIEKDIINQIFNTILLTDSNFLNYVKKAIFEKFSITDDNTDFLDNLISSNINSTLTIDGQTALEYLIYSGTTSVYSYLESENYLTGTKADIINAAAGDKDVFVELMQILFDETRTFTVADPSTGGTGYGAPIDLPSLFTALGGTSTTDEDDGVAISNKYAFPIKASSQTIISKTGSTSAYSADGSNKASIDYASTQSSASDNIGYIIGGDIKLYRKTGYVDYTKFYHASTSDYSTELTGDDLPDQDIIDYLTAYATDSNGNYIYDETGEDAQKVRNGDFMVRLSHGSQMQYNNASCYYVVENGTISGTTSDLLLPKYCILVSPVQEGTMKFVVVGGNTNKTGFRVEKLQRKVAGDFTTNLTKISNALEVNAQILPGLAYYYELEISEDDVAAGYEYAITCGDGGTGDGYKPFVTYIDMGTSGGTTEEVNATVQTTIQETANYSLNVSKILNYLTPLEGKLSDGTYEGVTYTYTKATSYDSTETYYNVSSDGKYKAISGVTSENYSSYYVRTVNKSIEDYQNLLFSEEFKEVLVKSSKSALLELIKLIDDKDGYIYVIDYMISLDTNIFDSIISSKEEDIRDDANYWQLLAAGYYASNYYYYGSSDMTNTLLYQRLQELDTDYQYITGASTIDNDKFAAFCEYIGYDLNDMAFGIYALSSSTGIKNGTFIPDNLDIEAMDVKYNILATDDFSSLIIALTDSNSPSWRDNTGVSTSGSYDTSVETSVNHAFRIEMKQLRKAISTSLFELDIVYSDSIILYASDSTIDEENGTITYYVPSDYVSNLKKVVTISDIVIADTASYTTNTDAKTIDLSSGVTSGTSYIVSNALRVTAEDTSVYKDYDIIITPVTVSFDIESVSLTELDYSGGTVLINVTTTNIPDNFDFTPFLSITNGANTYKLDDIKPTFELTPGYSNNGVVYDNSTTISIDIFSNMPGGTLDLVLSVFGVSDSESITKTMNSEAKFEDFVFVSTDLKSTLNSNKTASSYIKFGRAYNYTELTNPDSSDFYLTEFSISDNATVVITATYANITDSDRIAYTVTYEITSEDETTTNTYTHVLTEMDYFTEGNAYATLYMDGSSLVDTDLYTDDFTYNDSTVYGEYSSLLWDSDDSRYVVVQYNRGLDPEYRIKYILDNFYTIEGATYSITDDTAAYRDTGATVNLTYRGITVMLTDKNQPSVYKFEYVYQRTGTWDGGEKYTREYTFPTLYLVKDYSIDSLLHRLTFLDQYVMVGNTATVMKTNTASSTSIVQTVGTDDTFDTKEVTYTDLFSSSSRDIEVKGTTIRYSNNTDSSSVSDYYAIGTVSDTELTYYAPTFGTEEHAQIYQYTTVTKLQSYGLGSQDSSDSEILTVHDDILLYVPFIDSSNNLYIYLVLLDSNGLWSKVYSTDYDGTNEATTLLHEYTTPLTTYDATNTSASSFDGYSVLEYSSDSSSNPALYMDYIGNPCENHFWYVSYIVFSEAALHGEYEAGYVRYYHISIIDATNTIYFEVELYAPEDFAKISAYQTLYMTISENIYSDETLTSTRQISGYLVPQYDEDDNFITGTTTDTEGLVLYKLRFKLQTLPKGYFYFYIDLPDGYYVTVTTDMENQLSTSSSNIQEAEEGSFLPITYIFTKTINLTYIVYEGKGDNKSVWAVATSDIYTRQATYIDPADNTDGE